MSKTHVSLYGCTENTWSGREELHFFRASIVLGFNDVREVTAGGS